MEIFGSEHRSQFEFKCIDRLSQQNCAKIRRYALSGVLYQYYESNSVS